MKVGLIGPEIEENLALRSIAASLEAAGHEARIFDFRAPGEVARVAGEVAAWAPGLVGLSMVFTARSREFMDLAGAIRAAGFGGHLTAGGHFAALNAADLLRDCPALDSIVHGEGEEPMVELAADPAAAGRVAGLTVRGPGGAAERTGPRAPVDDLDARPWSLRPAAFHAYLGQPIANLLASRGCWADCAFCSINAFHRAAAGGGRSRHRERRVEALAAEMAHLYHDRGVRIFDFQDDNFLLPARRRNLARLGALRDELGRARVGRIALQAKARPDCIDEEVLDLACELGLFRFFLGVETDAVAGLRTLGRGVERAQNHRALEVLRDRGVHTCFNLLMFDPGSTLGSIAENVDFMRRQSWFPLNFCRVEVYAGTAIEARLRAEGRLEGDYRRYTYTIADPRAQLAFEVFREVFWPRNFGLGALHHESMRTDYVYHVLRHFWPDRATAPLERRVKGLVHELNVNSADLMDHVLDLAGSPRWDDRSAVRAEAARLSGRLHDADLSIGGRLLALRGEIEALARGEEAPGPARREFLRAAAASTAAAALIAAAPGCHRQGQDDGIPFDSHMCETAPEPPPPAAVLPPEEAAAIGYELSAMASRVLGQRFHELQLIGVDLALQLRVEPGGRVVSCMMLAEIDMGFRDQLCGLASAMQFSSAVFGGEGQVTVRVDRPALLIDQPAPVPDDDTHMCETVPDPGYRKRDGD